MARKNNIGRRPQGTPSTGRPRGMSAPVLEGDDTLVDIVEVRDQGLDFFERNRNLILGIAVAFFVAVAGYFVYQTFVKIPAEKNAAVAMQQAQVQFERDSFALALTNPGNGGLGFLDIISEYGSTKAGNLANYYAAVSYLNLQEPAAALDYIGSFDADGKLLPAMKYGVMGDAQSELDQMDKAAASYQDAVDAAGDNFLTAGYYLNKLALLQLHQGKDAEALASFKRLKTDFGNSPEAAGADKYISMLEAK